MTTSNSNLNPWANTRYDLEAIPMMEANGWTVVFSDVDETHNRTTPENVPHDAVAFKKGNKVVWMAGKSLSEGYTLYWRAADLIDGYYRNHKSFDTLENVLKADPDEVKTDNIQEYPSNPQA